MVGGECDGGVRVAGDGRTMGFSSFSGFGFRWADNWLSSIGEGGRWAFPLLACLAFDGRTIGFLQSVRAGDGLFFSFSGFGFRWAGDGLSSIGETLQFVRAGGRWAFPLLACLAFGGRTMGFLQSVRADDGLFSLLAGLAFGGRTIGFLQLVSTSICEGGRWAFFNW